MYNKKNKYKQQMCLLAMKEIGQLFEENEIWYCLSYGSALGAYREGGFIEWDGDIDILIKCSDQERVNGLLKENLSNAFKLISYKEETVSGFDEVDIKGISSDEMHIDIYPLIGGPDSIDKGYKFQKYCRLIHRIFDCKYLDINRLQSKWKVPFVYALRGIEYLFPNSILRGYIEHLEDKYPIETAKYIFPFSNNGKKGEYMEQSKLMCRKKMKFEDTEFYVPKEIEFYLEAIYGSDFMTPVRY